MLISHYQSLHGIQASVEGLVGTIDPDCDILQVAEQGHTRLRKFLSFFRIHIPFMWILSGGNSFRRWIRIHIPKADRIRIQDTPKKLYLCGS